MDNNQIVGRDCSLITIVPIIQQSTLIQNNWSTLARRLNVSNSQVKALRQNLLLNTITFEDLIFEVLEIWVGKNGGNATLSNLLEVVEENCEANDVGELLRLEYKLPRKLADDNHSLGAVSQHQSSLSFQEAKNQDHRKGAGGQSSTPVESTSPGMLRRAGTAVGSAVAGYWASANLLFTKPSVGASPDNEGVEIRPQHIYTALPGALSKLLNSSDKHHAVFHTSSRQSTFDLGEKSGGQNYVNMPLTNFNGLGDPKWDIVLDELTKLEMFPPGNKKIAVGPALAESIKAYGDSANETNFKILEHPDISHELTNTLPTIVEYALQLPTLLGEPIPYLKRRVGKTIYVTRRLACSLLAHCFLCTVPHEGRPYYMPTFHLLNLFHMDQDAPWTKTQAKLEKLKCILDYFDQMANISEEKADSIISFERRCIPQQQDWNGSQVNLCDFSCNSQNRVEGAKDMLQVVLADKRLEGCEAIFSHGMVEEIRFVISPELILSRLFTESLQDDEVLIVTGTKQFTTYSGCGPTLRFWTRVRVGDSGKDPLGREYCQVVAMDAFQSTSNRERAQFEKRHVDRELHKCYVGFSHRGRYLAPVATGDCGCGVFNGDKELRILLQWMAASMVGRPSIAFYTSEEHSKEIEKIGRVLQDKNVSVGKLYKCLMKYESMVESPPPLSLFQFILNEI